MDADYYRDHCPLEFDPDSKKAELHQIERDIYRQLGQLNPLATIMRRTCREYQMVVRMLEARGTTAFSDLSQELYGASSDVFHAADPTVADLGIQMESVLEGLLSHKSMLEQPKSMSPQEAVAELNERLARVFPDGTVHVKVSDGIAADAAAGKVDTAKMATTRAARHRRLPATKCSISTKRLTALSTRRPPPPPPDRRGCPAAAVRPTHPDQ